jgi:hypothetical protein
MTNEEDAIFAYHIEGHTIDAIVDRMAGERGYTDGIDDIRDILSLNFGSEIKFTTKT